MAGRLSNAAIILSAPVIRQPSSLAKYDFYDSGPLSRKHYLGPEQCALMEVVRIYSSGNCFSISAEPNKKLQSTVLQKCSVVTLIKQRSVPRIRT